MANSPDTLNAIIPASVDELVNKSIAEMSYTLSKYYGTSLQFLSPNNINYLIIVALCSRVFDMYSALKYSMRNLLMPYATGEFLDLYGFNKGLTRLEAQAASGRVFLSALSAGTTLTIGTTFKGNNDLVYTTTETKNSELFILNITNVAIYNNKATLTLSLPSGWSDTGMYTGQTITVSGISDPIFNGQKLISVNNNNTIQFDVPFGTSNPVSISGSSITFTGVLVNVSCNTTSELSNLKAGAILTIDEPVLGFESIAYTCFSGLSGGNDGESDADFSSRVIYRYQNPMVSLGESDVQFRLSNYDPALTTFKVNRSTPSDGKTVMLCGYQGKTSSERSINSTILNNYKTLVLDRTYLGIEPADLTFSNFTYVPVTINVSDVLPNDENLKTTIRQNLENLFLSRSYGVAVKLQDIRSVIESSTSLGGVSVSSYTLNNPTSNVTIGANEIATLGTLTVTG